MAHRYRSIRELIRDQFTDEIKIVFTREMTDGYLAVYTKGAGADLQERCAFFTTGTIDNQPAIRLEWDNACEGG